MNKDTYNRKAKLAPARARVTAKRATGDLPCEETVQFDSELLIEKPRCTEPRRARVMEVEHLDRAIQYVRGGNNPEADILKLVLSFYAGLRVSEIASLSLSAVLDAQGEIADHIWLSAELTKGGRERTIPMHPRIASALDHFLRRHPDLDFFAFSARRGRIRRQSPNTLAVWFKQTYADAGLIGCSSHSGRRSFVTHLARIANLSQCSMHDVQRLAGHRRLDTTQAYIEPSENVAALVQSLGAPRKRQTNPKTNLNSSN